ncbi:MAG: signal peptidase I [Chitinophagales bacterium]|nr:signal peptidase I [Chitinophagales bacterium]
MSILIFLIVSYLLLSFSLSKLFPKAGVDSVKGWIPGVNFAEWAKLIGRKPQYAFWLLFPIVNLFIFCGMAVDMVRSFGKLQFKDSALAVIYAPLAFFKIASNPNDKYLGPTIPKEAAYAREIEEARKAGDTYKLNQLTAKNPYKKSVIREWTESIVFAVFAASFIRMFLIEAYVIPTPSMEGSLNVGDFLFVSKAHYGIRLPMTVLAFPLVHNQMPLINSESYLKEPSLPYKRLPALESIESGKPIVFNWPIGDSVYITHQRSYAVSQVARQKDWLQYDRELADKVKRQDYVVRPIDKKDHYIKRCVAAPGDSLQIKDRQIYINGKPVNNPKHLQFLYEVQLPAGISVSNKKLDEWGIDFGDNRFGTRELFTNGYGLLFLDKEQVERLKSLDKGVQVKVFAESSIPDPANLFPFDTIVGSQNWSLDNYGPIWIPKAGATTPLDLKNLPFYRRIIEVYENNQLEVKGSDIYINGQKVDAYTFKQDYYWAMGDNRHNSEDSRAWGYVPHDHIVGKPLFIWFSTKEGNMSNGINWDRIFKSATKD